MVYYCRRLALPNVDKHNMITKINHKSTKNQVNQSTNTKKDQNLPKKYT